MIDRDKTFRALLLMILTSIPKKIETALLKTRNMRPNYRGRVNWNMHSVVVQCLYLPTSMLLLTLAMMGALGPPVVFRIQLPKWVLKNSL